MWGTSIRPSAEQMWGTSIRTDEHFDFRSRPSGFHKFVEISVENSV